MTKSGRLFQRVFPPESKGTIITILASNTINSGEFYALNNRGIFISNDSGMSWSALDIHWPKMYNSD
ncbi:MAG TPA: hypothetical protein VHH33_02915 [Nitrososphaeraceae archaeon]|jgi:hypothetical protein|nr:hypothetical protein [Nitrososphaeraceae archaeon]